MLSADLLVEALQRRMQLVDPHRRRPAGEMPAGWNVWLASLSDRAGVITGATAQSLADIFLQRPLSNPPRRIALLSRWQAFTTLWRQNWHPPEREERSLRWFSGAVSVLWHVFFVSLMLSLLYVHYVAKIPPPLGEDIVQVEFIGTGTPAEVGGGAVPEQNRDAEPPASETATTQANIEPFVAAATAVEVSPSLRATLPDVIQRDVPEPQMPAAPTAQQPVTVSKPISGETAVFVLPATAPRLATVRVEVPDLRADSQPVKPQDVPEPVQPLSRALPSREVVARPVESAVREVVAREVPAPAARVPVSELPSPVIAQPELSVATPQLRALAIPTPTSQAVQAADALAAPSSSRAATARNATLPTAATSGSGPKQAPAAGAWPTVKRGDEWGDSTRSTTGGQRGVPAGVYNSDGSVRLAEPRGSAAPGMPPGTIEDRITNLDRAGTWLKRKPNDYEPTTFDKYWRPNETLLAEWVRKSITTVRIPIPGTNKHIVCKTVLLALGGGCGITDPNLNEQPATARPPPDIPFKPELQEDNGSIRPGG